MQLLLDNIAATIIATSVMLMMLTSQIRNQLASAEATVFYMLERQMIDFHDVVRRDMQNLRSIESLDADDENFVFYAQTSPADTARTLVTYSRKDVSVRHEDDGSTTQLYQIVRYENGIAAGGSIGSIVDWGVAVLNDEGTEVASMADAAQISFSISAVAPIKVDLMEGVQIDESRWDATFHPRLLREGTL